ncbi:Iron-uptake system permease protein FeuC [Microbacterium azadirachtae]|uniref:Iron-uptake system permease protein FeuC n=1 Tax=Microbacterium azadirachtae TaxID=582680 RepID=A0A0F0KIH3_9MICO|nr:iron chelate uptake ABC transporter family permease subunit [Microbacterium azadirachtae]KJL19955.1 Iron-uptake system permease protein FeuC [Microbacterium azadirachtae]
MAEALTASTARVGSAGGRTSGAFPTARARRRYALVVAMLAVVAGAALTGLLVHGNPMPFGTDGFWRIVQLRVTGVVVILVVAVAQATATVAFQTAANNRIVTPSIMGFESLYTAIQTAAVFALGAAGVTALQGVPQFALQIVLMTGFAVALYGWLLSGRRGSMHVMLLVGIVIGGGLGAVSTFLQRMLTPSEFDVLSARLFGSIANAEASYLPLAIPLCLTGSVLLLLRSRRLNVLALGSDAANALRVDHRREQLRVLLLVAVLMATSTALVGPMTFLGFLVATLAYQLADTHDHRLVLPVAILAAIAVLGGAYFVMKHVFAAQGAVSIIIELVGGSVFLLVLLRKGRL